MAPISLLLFLITIVQFYDKAFSTYYFRPYPNDIIKKFSSLRFRGVKSTYEVSGLEQKLSVVKKQIQRMEKVRQRTTMADLNIVDWIPGAGGYLQTALRGLVDHLLSAADLEDLSTDEKIQLGFQTAALAKGNFSNFKAKVEVLKRHLKELSSDVSTASKKDSAKLAIPACEEILKLFRDEKYFFWEFKLIFYPHLMSFTGLFATVATAAAKLHPEKLDTLKEDMERLRATVLKFHPVVKGERLNKLQVPRLQNHPDFDLIHYCPKMQYLTSKPSSPFTSCLRGDSRAPETKEIYEDGHHYGRGLDENSAIIMNDTVTGAIFCGWEYCWSSLKQHIGSEMDKFTMSALELIPFRKPPSQLPPASKRDYSQCQLDQYDRLSYGFEYYTYEKPGEYFQQFGCYRGYCSSKCALGWCYTRDTVRGEYAQCKRQEDCCPEWKCHGACSL